MAVFRGNVEFRLTRGRCAGIANFRAVKLGERYRKTNASEKYRKVQTEKTIRERHSAHRPLTAIGRKRKSESGISSVLSVRFAPESGRWAGRMVNDR